MIIKDKLGRQFKTLRLSLTSRCNFACNYCVPENKTVKMSPICKAGLSYEELAQEVLKIHKLVNLKNVRLTGGEPTLYKDLIPLIRLLKEMKIPKVTITTNGHSLERLIGNLVLSGIDAINISLDAIDATTFKKLSRRNSLEKVLRGIEKTLEYDIPVKINSTIMKGQNDDQIIPLLDYALERNATIRFLELMQMGHLYQNHNQYFFSEEEILDKIAKKYNFEKTEKPISSTANYWNIETINNKENKFGIIANHSSPFCGDCDRLRLDENGKIYGCLSVNKGFRIKENNLPQILPQALAQKQSKHFHGSELSMQAIGG